MSFIRWIADAVGYVPREEMEARMAELDQEMRERLAVASDKAAAKLREVEASVAEKDRRIAELEGAAASDASNDAEALRPIVEFLEGLGASATDPVPAVDPVPSDPTPVPGTEPGAPADGGPVAEQPAEGGTPEQPGATTDAPVDPGTGEVQGGSAV
jgi:hypothetical protein